MNFFVRYVILSASGAYLCVSNEYTYIIFMYHKTYNISKHDHVSTQSTLIILYRTDKPGDVRVPDHLCLGGALHLRGLPPALHQTPLPDLLPQAGAPRHPVCHNLHPAHLLHARQLMWKGMYKQISGPPPGSPWPVHFWRVYYTHTLSLSALSLWKRLELYKHFFWNWGGILLFV